MSRAHPLNLSRRERQITDILFRLGRATADEVWRQMPNAPTYTTVRGLLRILEEKGHIAHDTDGLRYVYYPLEAKESTGQSMLTHVVSTFFGGSPANAMAALLGNDGTLSDDEFERISKLVSDARKKERRK